MPGGLLVEDDEHTSGIQACKAVWLTWRLAINPKGRTFSRMLIG
jgi:hypothetical protein